MPIDFLTNEQRRSYGRYTGEPSAEQLARYSHLDNEDKRLVALRRGDHNRLDSSLLLVPVRFLGTFLADEEGAVRGYAAGVAGRLHPDAAPHLLRKLVERYEGVAGRGVSSRTR